MGGCMQVPAQVEYEKAASVRHALALLARYGPEAKVLAGGHSLIPMMKLRLAPPELLTEIRLPIRPGGGSGYLKVARRAGDWPVGAAGAAVWLADGIVAEVG